MDQLYKLLSIIQEVIDFYDLLTRESYEALGIELHQIIEQLKGVLIQLNRVLAKGSGGASPPPTYS